MRGIYDTILNDPALATQMRRAQNRTDYRNKPAKPKERKTTMPRRSTKELETLSERKWGELTPGERRSVRNWMKRTHDDDTELDLETADLLEHNQHISIARAYAIVHNVTAEPAPTAPMEPEPAAEPAPTADTLQALADENNIQWLDEWPDDATTAHRRIGRWQKVADALRSTGRPAVICDGLNRKGSLALARAINEGRTGTWRPKGAYRAGVRDGDHPQVIAQWIGGERS
ncbi:hypothetical protein [Bifidobacterium merycicum]|uniref:Uncharacterized protein n=1 Tax=Bifidobacterium merycicum TaxID=78345 RepID=A0A087BHA2_9BIFI|nr:hypothetical protein [Bifidobacterium merycicum]KFI70402.1 hypothetical protein BMERY_0896 [Bifidobacterium merycicum]SHE50179.1 hypothetical protein SAMN02745589_0923 [Bifidobacterium merycicum DSM 6492]